MNNYIHLYKLREKTLPHLTALAYTHISVELLSHLYSFFRTLRCDIMTVDLFNVMSCSLYLENYIYSYFIYSFENIGSLKKKPHVI